MSKKNIFSILMALLIMFLSLASSDTFDKIHLYHVQFFDKIAHLGMYFTFMSVIILENRNKFKSTGAIFLTALIPLFYSILMEILQATITKSRSGSFFDVIFNLAGILLSVLLWLSLKPYIKDRIR
jgi:VanZ family protein